MNKRIIALALTLVMLFSAASVFAAAGDIQIKQSDGTTKTGDASVWPFDGFIAADMVASPQNYTVEADNGNLYSVKDVFDAMKKPGNEGKKFKDLVPQLTPVTPEAPGDFGIKEITMKDAKTFVVNFTKAVDAAKFDAAIVSVKLGLTDIAAASGFPKLSADKKSFTYEAAAALVAGKYTITVKYDAKELVKTTTVKSVGLAKIEIQPLNIVQDTQFTPAIKQKDANGFDLAVATTLDNFEIKIKNVTQDADITVTTATDWKTNVNTHKNGDKIKVTVTYKTDTDIKDEKEFVVGAPDKSKIVKSITLSAVQPAKDKTIVEVGDAIKMEVTVKAEDDSKIKFDLAAASVASGTKLKIGTVESTMILTYEGVDTVAIAAEDEAGKQYITMKAATAGTAKVKVIDINTSKQDEKTFTIEAKASGDAKSATFGNVEYVKGTTIIAGQTGIKLPITVKDENGKAFEFADVAENSSGTIELKVSGTTVAKVKFDKDDVNIAYKDGKLIIKAIKDDDASEIEITTAAGASLEKKTIKIVKRPAITKILVKPAEVKKFANDQEIALTIQIIDENTNEVSFEDLISTYDGKIKITADKNCTNIFRNQPYNADITGGWVVDTVFGMNQLKTLVGKVADDVTLTYEVFEGSSVTSTCTATVKLTK